PDVDQPLEFAVNIDGHLNDLQLQTFKLGIRDSYFNITGKVKNLINASKMHYTFQIDTLRLEKDDLKKLLKNTNNTLLNSLNNLKLAGFAEGSSDTLSLNIEAESPAGRFGFMGSTQLKKPYHFLGRLSGNNINLVPFIQAGIDTTALSFNAAIEGQNPSLTGGHFYFKGDVYNSLFGHIPIDSLRLKATLN